MKTYNKEVSRYDKNSNESRYICSVCELEDNLSLHWSEQQYVKKIILNQNFILTISIKMC